MDLEKKLMDQIHDCGYYAFHGHKKNKRQEKVLEILLYHDGISQKELLNILEIQPGSLSELLSKLEAKQFIVKKKKENDKRKISVFITDQGKEYIEKFVEDEQEIHYFNSLSLKEQEELSVLLDKVLNDWKKDYGPNVRKRMYGK